MPFAPGPGGNPTPGVRWTAPTLDGVPLDIPQTIYIAMQLNVGPPVSAKCHACEEPAGWHCICRMSVGGRTVMYATIFHCRDHRPTQGQLLYGWTPNAGVKAKVQILEVFAPPASPAWERGESGGLGQPPTPVQLR